MKKIIKIFSLILLLVSLMLFNTSNIFALATSGYKNINEKSYIYDYDTSIQFTELQFKQVDDAEYETIGLTGFIYNINNYDILIDTSLYFYDSTYNVIAKSYGSRLVSSKEFISYNDFIGIDRIEEGYTFEDIIYYRLDFTVDEQDDLNSIPNYDYQYGSYEYVLNKYDINIDVKENNIFEITENIGAYFNVYKHGIFRKLPLKNNIERLDGTKSQNRVKISDIFVNENYTTYKENGYQVIKIGDANYTLTGQKDYTINYSYNLGKDTGKDYDELYFNLIGDEWDTIIDNVTFSIKMPKEFDESKLGFSKGKKGSTDNDGITYNVDGNVITGEFNGILYPGEALTVRLELPEGYFVGASNNYNQMTIIMVLVPLVCLLISIFLWFKYGRDSQVIETVEFYPPEGLNSLDLAFLYKGSVEDKDVTSLLVYLANKGYIKISEKESKTIFSKSKGFMLTKLKEYDGNDKNEKLFMEGLFKKRRSVSYSELRRIVDETKQSTDTTEEILERVLEHEQKETVTASDLYNSFYRTMNKIIKNVDNKENKEKIFEKKASRKKIFVIILLIISLLTSVAIPSYDYGDLGGMIMVVFLCLFYSPFYAVGIFAKIPKGMKIFWLGFTIFHSFMFFIASPLGLAVRSEMDYLICFIFDILCIIGIILCLKFLPKRNPYGNEMLGKIKGFKNFLETAEKDRLEAMVLQNPSYFYDILPYTYVLGISDKWIKKFESISLQAPDWYVGSSTFNINSFGSFMNNTMSSARSSMSSSPSSSSGGGSSGGGSSGGGSGGGGGGSW